MIPAIDFTIVRHDYPISVEQALKLLNGPVGHYRYHAHKWQLDLRQKCIELVWDNLLNIHAAMGIDHLHLAISRRKAQYPSVELITTSREWWNQPYEFLKEYGRSHGHGDRDIGVGYPIYSYTLEYKYFSLLEEGMYDTRSKQRLGEPYRYIADENKWK